MSSAGNFTPTVTLANNGVTVVYDTTYGFGRATSTTVVGPFRSRRANHRCAGSVTCTDQNVTLRLDGLENGAWVTGISSTTVTAGNTQPFDFLSRHPDWRVVIVNGATGPTTLVVEAQLIRGDRSPGA